MAKKAAYNTRIQITDPADSSVIRVKHLGDISGPEVSVAVVDVTAHDSPDGFSESLAGIAEAGDVTFELFFDPNDNGHSRLVAMVDERRAAAFVIRLPADSTQLIPTTSFSGSVVGWVRNGNFTIGGGVAYYTAADPVAGDYIEATLTVAPLIAESYVVAITFTGTTQGTASVNVLHGGAVVGTVNPSEGGTQYVRWDAVSTSLLLRIEVPSSISTLQTFSIAGVSMLGITSNTATRFNFTGLVTKVGILAPVGDALKAPVSVKISGAPVYTRV
jgi:hypothetical protein